MGFASQVGSSRGRDKRDVFEKLIQAYHNGRQSIKDALSPDGEVMEQSFNMGGFVVEDIDPLEAEIIAVFIEQHFGGNVRYNWRERYAEVRKASTPDMSDPRVVLSMQYNQLQSIPGAPAIPGAFVASFQFIPAALDTKGIPFVGTPNFDGLMSSLLDKPPEEAAAWCRASLYDFKDKAPGERKPWGSVRLNAIALENLEKLEQHPDRAAVNHAIVELHKLGSVPPDAGENTEQVVRDNAAILIDLLNIMFGNSTAGDIDPGHRQALEERKLLEQDGEVSDIANCAISATMIQNEGGLTFRVAPDFRTRRQQMER